MTPNDIQNLQKRKHVVYGIEKLDIRVKKKCAFEWQS